MGRFVLASLAVRGQLTVAAVVFAIGVSACSGCDGPSARELASGVAGPGEASSRSRDALSLAPSPGTCASPSDVACADGCCPDGGECNPDGGCDAPLGGGSPPSCPAELPVACSRPTSCADGACVTADSSGRGNHATLAYGAGFVPGLLGTAAATHEPGSVSAGYGSLITAPTSGLPLNGNPFTVELWVRSDAGSQPQALFGFGGESDGSLVLRVDGTTWAWPDSSGCQRTGPAINDGQWHFVAAVYASPGSQTLHVDGVELPSCGSSQQATSADRFHLLNRPLQPLGFRGEVDEVRILDRALTAAEVQGDRATLPLQPVPGTVALWHFDSAEARACCPSGTSCGADGTCHAASTGVALPQCPSSAPVLCADGGCCAAGESCNPGGCGPAPATACPSVGEVACPGRADCCPAGSVCGDGGTCERREWARDPRDAGSCAAGEAPCGAGCCGANEVCSDSACCPSGSSRCPGSALCCPTGFACDGATCRAPAVDAGACPGGTTACGASCCPAGSACSAGRCVQTPPQQATCTSAERPVLCGDTCCGASPACVGLGTSCFCAPGGGCRPLTRACPCPDGASCGRGFRGQLVCRYGTPPAPRTGATGPDCGADPQSGTRRYCPAATYCAGAGCCPADHPVLCGSACCLPGAPCEGGACGCPGGAAACGDRCCGPGSRCRDGACVAVCDTPGFPTRCGAGCCAAGIACVDGECSCPSSHPDSCGGSCCLAGGPCEAGRCGCPSGRVECGGLCCADGQKCESGECRTPPPAPVCGPQQRASSCPDGSSRCCSVNQVCCRDSASGGAIGCQFQGFCG